MVLLDPRNQSRIGLVFGPREYLQNITSSLGCWALGDGGDSAGVFFGGNHRGAASAASVGASPSFRCTNLAELGRLSGDSLSHVPDATAWVWCSPRSV